MICWLLSAQGPVALGNSVVFTGIEKRMGEGEQDGGAYWYHLRTLT